MQHTKLEVDSAHEVFILLGLLKKGLGEQLEDGNDLCLFEFNRLA